MKKIIGIGNALVDILIRLNDDSTLDKYSLPKGSMQLVDATLAQKIIDETQNLPQGKSSGGSAANTIHGLAALGMPVGFLGTVGKDSLGDFFKSDLVNNHIEAKLFVGKEHTGTAVALISPDSERTFATFLGAAVEIDASHITPEIFKGYDCFHAEGYLVFNHSLIEKALKTAKECGLVVSIDLASYNVVEANLEFLKEIVEKYADIVFANEEEARSFTGCEPEEAVIKISKSCKIAVVKTGKNGSLIKSGNEMHRLGVIKANSIDTTGAGDLYAAGFLYGLMNNKPLNKCGELGALLAGNVIEVIGAKMDDARWNNIKKLV
jgi:sugar/nucleoside kinase (ribokinase family)